MKRIKRCAWTLALALCLLLALAVCAHGEEYSPAVFKTTPFEAVQSGTVSTTLYLEEGSNLIDFEMQLTYDTELMTLQGVVAASDLTGDMEITPKDGAVHISYTRTSSNATKKTDLAVLTFTVDENVGPASYDFLKVDTAYSAEAHTMIEDDLYAIPMETAFAPLNIYNHGDIDLNSKVSIADVTVLRQHLAHMRTLSDYQLGLADAYYDAAISIADAVRIQQYLANHTVQLGNRVNVSFMDKDGALYRTKSVEYGHNLATIPALPEYVGYYGGVWSLDPKEEIGTDFTALEQALNVYAIYKKDASDAVTFYKERLKSVYYSQETLTDSLNLVNKLTYQNGYTADIYWSSSNSAVLNATTGKFTRPNYDSSVTLTATIISYQDGMIEAQDYIAFDYTAAGEFLCPSKEEIGQYLADLFTGESITNNLTLPGKVSSEDIQSDNKFEVRLNWLQRGSDGQDQSVVQLARSNEEQTVTLIAVATFNGKPLEDDGKIYFDNVKLSAVTQDEVRSYLINEIAAHTGISVTNGETFWAEDDRYHCQIKWISENHDVATIEDNTISIKDVVNGTALPVTVEATYTSGEKSMTIRLAYTLNVVTSNTLLVPGTNIDATLYDALKAATGVHGNLTTDALKSTKFVYLDLSDYPAIQDLRALTYCTNLRVLNISGLHVDETSLNQIATLSKLEALIANHCGIESLTVGGVPVLDKMINLKMLDLSYNNLTNLDSVFSRDNRYGQLEELYLNDNQLTDISALCETAEETSYIYDAQGEVAATYVENVIRNRAPMLRFLLLDNNHLDDGDMAAFGNFKVLKFLSLDNNELTSVSSFRDIRSLLELHLQGNHIEDVRDLRFLTHLESLYLSHNNIRNVYSGAKEVNVSYLKYLTELEILYLNDNDIEDISDLSPLNKLAVLNVNNNQIQDLSVLADKGDTLVELYAENNCIDSFSFIQRLTSLTRLMLSHNGEVYESALNSYLSNLTQLQTLTLSGKELRSLDFLNHLTKLVRLDVAECNIPAYCITSAKYSGTAMSVESYVDNISAILSLKSTLKYLDVSNNGLAYSAKGMKEYLKSIGNTAPVESISFSGAAPDTFDSLYEMTNLKVLYADNLVDPVNASHLFSVMTGLRYLSMENCGIDNAAWLTKFKNLVFVDLAGNSLTDFDLGSTISLRSRGTLESLYIDAAGDCEVANAFDTFDGNVMRRLSLAGAGVETMDKLPDMADLEYLNLSNTGITNLIGENQDFDGWFKLSRYQKVKTLDISGLQTDIDEVENLPALETLYAVGGVEDAIFQKHNLLKLRELYLAGVDCYLYHYDSQYIPVAKTEGDLILGTLEDYSCAVTVAKDGVISGNNPVLASQVNGFDITWSVSDPDHYEVRDNQLTVHSTNGIDDGQLTLTASIEVYPDQPAVTREFTIDVSVLRLSEENIGTYLVVNETNASPYLERNAAFTYDVSVTAAATEGFSVPVAPVYDYIEYTYQARLAGGSTAVPASVIANDMQPSYTVMPEAPIGAVATITVDIGHYTGDMAAHDDYTIGKTITISNRTFTLTYVTNGGSVVSNVDGHTITSEQRAEETNLFEDVQTVRPGYLLNGWFIDEDCTELFWQEGQSFPLMPSNDLTLYASWTAYQFNVLFDGNTGTVSTASKPVLVGTPYGDLPTPVKTGYTFDGWFTAIDGGEKITADTLVQIEADQTLYAHWTVNTYTLTFNPNGGTCAEGSKTVTYDELYGTLPTPTRTGFAFSGWYSAAEGGTGFTSGGLVQITDDQTLYAHWTANSYTASWSAGTGYSITVKRTASPYAGATIGTMTSGSTVYYGDVLSVTYAASTGYKLGTCGAGTVTVTGNVGSSVIYGSAQANNYTYNIVFKSSNGTSLGSTTATYAYGTTNKITAPGYTGYATPAAQSIKWDSTSTKTITFVYKPNSVATSQYMSSGNWQNNGWNYLTYSANVEYQNRTANSVQVRVVWTQSIKSAYYGYNQHFYASFNNSQSYNTGTVDIAYISTWKGSAYHTDSRTVYSPWVTVSVSSTQTSIPVGCDWWTDSNSNGCGSWYGTISIPAY